jgi:cell division septation protein DedD
MNDEPTPRGNEGSHPEDDRLVKDLESLSKSFDYLNHFDVVSSIAEDPERCYKILRINSEASLDEIHNAFERMNEAWHPDRYPYVLSWEEKSRKKLIEIRIAYEKLLSIHSRPENASQEDVPSTPLIAKTVAKPEYYDQERPSPSLTSSVSSSSIATDSSSQSASFSSKTSRSSEKLLRRVIVIGLPAVIVCILIFLWPSLYHYEAIKLGGREYPFRINRINSHTTYYDGNQWIAPPIQHDEAGQQEVVKPLAAKPEAPVMPQQPSLPAQPPQSASPSPAVQSASPAQPAQPPQPIQSVQPLKPPLPDNSSMTEFTVTGKPALLPKQQAKPRPSKRENPPPEVAVVKVNTSEPYSIQIVAYPEKYKAVDLAKRLRVDKFSARVEEVAIKGKGRWHRVLLGNFKNRPEALKYYNDHNIGKLYPQSFIQKPANF